MDKQHFQQLVKGVREMKRHIAGKSVRGARTSEFFEPDVRAIREHAPDRGGVAALGGADQLFVHRCRLLAAPASEQRQRGQRSRNPDAQLSVFHP